MKKIGLATDEDTHTESVNAKAVVDIFIIDRTLSSKRVTIFW